MVDDVVDPFCKRSGESRVHSRRVWRGTAVSPADDAVLHSCVSVRADDRSARVALARVSSAVRDSIHVQVGHAAAELAVFDFFSAVGRRDALLVRENVDSDVSELVGSGHAAAECSPAGDVAHAARRDVFGRQANRRPAVVAVVGLRLGQVRHFEEADVVSCAVALAETGAALEIGVVDDLN